MNEIFIERDDSFLRVAVKEKNNLKECFIEDELTMPCPGQIYLGRVTNIVPAISCAFIDIGTDKNCYLYIDKSNFKYKKGDMLLVEILKEGIGGKGPKVTDRISIPGSLLVVEKGSGDLSFSKKLLNQEFMEEIEKNMTVHEDADVILRTSAERALLSDILEEYEKLYALLKKIIKKGSFSLNIGLIYSFGGIVGRILRDFAGQDIKRIVCDNEEDFRYIDAFIKEDAVLNTSVEFYKDKNSLFYSFGIEQEIFKLRSNKIFLKSGGYIILNKTEAMHVIDVNSGSSIKFNSIKKTALATNLEAASEIVRQVRLRNLNGIIVIDFIDMTSKKDQEAVLCELNKGFEDDKNKTAIYPFTELNLVQIARRRRGRSMADFIEEDCPHCSTGRRINFIYLEFLIKNKVMELTQDMTLKAVHISLSKVYKEDIFRDQSGFVERIGATECEVFLSYVDENDFYKVKSIVPSIAVENKEILKING